SSPLEGERANAMSRGGAAVDIRTPPHDSLRSSAPPPGRSKMLSFETLTLVPIDTRCVDASLLTAQEKDWLNAYHARVLAAHESKLAAAEQAWLKARCAAV